LLFAEEESDPFQPDCISMCAGKQVTEEAPHNFRTLLLDSSPGTTCFVSGIQFDCEARNESIRSMRNIRLSLDEEFITLRETDTLRKWNSLDDQRVCAICDRVITGRMIDAWRDAQGSFHLHVHDGLRRNAARLVPTWAWQKFHLRAPSLRGFRRYFRSLGWLKPSVAPYSCSEELNVFCYRLFS
jgi:hypothetical protein